MRIRFFMFLICASHCVFVCAGKSPLEKLESAANRKKKNCESARKSRVNKDNHIKALLAKLAQVKQGNQKLAEECAALEAENAELQQQLDEASLNGANAELPQLDYAELEAWGFMPFVK